MTPTFTLSADEQQISRKLKRRDRNALLLYGLSGLVVVVVEEVAAFHFHMADRFGFAPLLARGVVYLILSTALWAMLLRANRRMVCKLMHEKQQNHESVMLAYDNALGLKDTYTGGHGRRVAFYRHSGR